MVKCYAPHAASHRGKFIEIADDGSCELSDEALADMHAHGFREWTDAPDFAAEEGEPNEPAGMSRNELLMALKGKAPGNIRFKKTDELRAIAARVLPSSPAPETPAAIVEADEKDTPLEKAAPRASKRNGHR